jgi:hypothetical protein
MGMIKFVEGVDDCILKILLDVHIVNLLIERAKVKKIYLCHAYQYPFLLFGKHLGENEENFRHNNPVELQFRNDFSFLN